MVLLGAFGCLWATLGAPLGDLGEPRGRLWDAWGLLGVPGGSPRASWDQPRPPGATRGRSGRVFTSKTTKNGDSCRDSRCSIVNPHNCRHFSAKNSLKNYGFPCFLTKFTKNYGFPWFPENPLKNYGFHAFSPKSLKNYGFP